MKLLLKFEFVKLTETIVATLLNNFDCFIIIEGGTGIGKSTLAWNIAKKVQLHFSKLRKLDPDFLERYYKLLYGEDNLEYTLEHFIEDMADRKKKDYRFHPHRDLIYTQKEMMAMLSEYKRIAIPDEMINVTFNRDFYSAEQKDIIKMINMYRDHNNLVLACVPRFQTLDNQIKNLCKIRITVVRRGVALVQTPNKTIYASDRWDSSVNEKIEREWILKGKKNPSYSRLSTVRGILKFPPMKKKDGKIYQKIKDEKRTIILKDKDKNKDGKKPLIERTVDLLLAGKIRNVQLINGMAIAEGISEEAMKKKLSTELQNRGKDPRLSTHYWDKKVGKGEVDGAF